ncbi:MAG: hypothetical protein FWC47_13125 [Oscillospiraceae bacterium]|nr:hypothetical protein [Oscillospiraceae bacterium]
MKKIKNTLFDAGTPLAWIIIFGGIALFAVVIVLVLIFIAISLIKRARKTNDLKDNDHGGQNK